MVQMQSITILLGTKNQSKVKELKKIANNMVGASIQLMSLNDLPYVEEPLENGNTFYENALIKAKYYYQIYQMPVITDDSGLCVDALKGMPGVFSARYASQTIYDASDAANRMKLLNEMKNVEDRNAHFCCAMVFYDGRHIITSEGKLEGKILSHEVGKNGFGYDSLFLPYGYHQSLGELDADTKNQMSHRFYAFNQLLEKLKKVFYW